ncbi:MAG: DUF1343 domain-containing protein [Bdellovibrionales bacterium]|nr:DUF1343 domain-containing protein [Bdellovibrionales bacterium]
MQLGIDRLLSEQSLQSKLKNKRVAFLGHPASVTSSLSSSFDELCSLKTINIVCAFGPQHGMRGEKQDNMIESDDYIDPQQKIPIFSLYGQVRRLTPSMWDQFDVLLVDLQDVGCRIYTFLTTLFYILEDSCRYPNKSLWVLDRPNPAGRPVEGQKLNMDYASFVGAAPLPMRHGFTLGEAASWYCSFRKINIDLQIVSMKNYDPEQKPDFGWPQQQLCWVNPSPNMPRLTTARQYAGTVLLEGTTLSEGRGTTRPLENFGAPGLDSWKILAEMEKFAPQWLKGCRLRPSYFEPTFHKYKGEMVSAIQIHVDDGVYDPEQFKPLRLICSYLKSVNKIYPDRTLWLKPPYEYEKVLMPIDILTGDKRVREWVEDKSATTQDLESIFSADENVWKEESKFYFLY